MTALEVAKQVDAFKYVQNRYALTFTKEKPQKACCPFHIEKSASFAYYASSNSFNCYGCGWNGSLVDFVMEKENLEVYEAAKHICDKEGLTYETTAKKTEKKPKDLDAEFRVHHEFLNNNLSDCYEALKAVFINVPFVMENKELWKLIGYDKKEKSLTIGVFDADGKCVNIVHRTRSDKPDDKWIGSFGGKSAIFPFDYLVRAEPTELFILEGLKDTINMCSVGIASVTLGGAGNSWKNIDKDFFTGIKKIYIALDADFAGYNAAINRATEIAKKTNAEIFIVFWEKVFGQELDLGFDATDFLQRTKKLDLPDIIRLIESGSKRFYKKDIESKKAQSKIAKAALLAACADDNSQASFINEMTFYKMMISQATDIKSSRDLSELDKAKYAFSIFKEKIKDVAFEEKKEVMTAFRNAIARALKVIEKDKNSCVSEIVEHFIRIAKSFNSDIDSLYSQCYFYTGTHWQKLEKTLLRKFIYNDFMDAINLPIGYKTEKLTGDILRNLEIVGKTLVIAQNREVPSDTIEIVARNGVITITANSVEFVEHSKKRGDRYCIDAEYLEDAIAPMFEEYLETALPDESTAKVILEFLAYSFMDSCKHNKMLILNGYGSNGKSTLLNIIRGFFPEEFTEFEGQFEGFGVANLRGKKLNIVADFRIDGLEKGELETIKKLTSGDYFKTRLMFTQEGELIKKPPKLILSTNSIPKNIDGAFLRRLFVIPFEKSFAELAADASKRAKKDLDLKILRNEKPGILNLIVKAAQRLLKQDKFTHCPPSEAAIEELSKDADNAVRFASERLCKDEEMFTSLDFIFEKYRAFCSEGGYKPKSKETFSKSIRAYFKLTANDAKRVRDKQGKFFVKLTGIGFNYTETSEDKEENTQDAS